MKKKLAAQIITTVVIFWSICLLIGFVIIGRIFYKETQRTSIQYAGTALSLASEQINNFIGKHTSIALDLNNQINGNLSNKKPRADVISFLEEEIQKHEYIYGLFAIYEPNAYDQKDENYRNTELHDDTGEFKVWVTKQGNHVITGASTLGYYQTPKKTKQIYITDPYYFEVKGEKLLFVTITIPLVEDGVFKGAIGCDIEATQMQSFCQQIKLWDGHGSVSIVDSKGNYITHTHEPDKIMQSIAKHSPDMDKRMKHLREGTQDFWRHESFSYLTSGIHLLDHLPKWQLRIKLETYYVYEVLIKTLTLITLSILLIMALGTLYIVRFIRRKISPLSVLSEIGNSIAAGDLTQTIDIETNNEVGVLAESFKGMIKNLKTFINQIQVNSETITSACSQLQGNAETLSQTSSEQASVTEEISSSTEEMNAAIFQTRENSREIAIEAKEVEEQMLILQKGAQEATTSMGLIVESSKNIDEVVRMVKILSLNAAVEAARAGEHGRGFAVVAREVQKLSENIEKFSNEINEKTVVSHKSSVEATNIVNEMAPKLKRLIDKVDEIALNAEEQASGISQISNGTQELNNGVQTIAASAEEQASSIEELNEQAINFNKLIKRYRIE